MLVLAGCSGSAPRADSDVPAEFPGHSAQQIHQRIRLSADTLTAYSAKARLTVESPEQSGQFTATIRQRRNDSLYMSISPGLGIEAARMLVTPDSFFVYDRIHKELTFGAVQDAQRRIPFLLTTEDVFENFLGILAPDPSVRWQVESDDTFYYLHDPDRRRSYTIDPARWRVVEYTQHAASGALVEQRVFSDFTTIAGVTLPQRVRLRRPTDQSSATLYYRDLELNPGPLSFNLHVSDDVTRIPLLGQRQ